VQLECFELEVSGKTALLELARPEQLNVLDERALSELELVLEHLQERGVKAVVLTGQGRAFAAGADVKAMAESASWQTALETKGWVDTYLDGDAFAAQLAEDIEATETILKDIGLVQ